MGQKVTCQTCHFLAKTAPAGDGHYTFCWSKQDLERLELKTRYAASCYMGVWDQGIDPSIDVKQEALRKRGRRECFYFKRRKAMSFPAGKLLQKRAAASEDTNRSLRLTQIGLGIAAIGLLLSAITQCHTGPSDGVEKERRAQASAVAILQSGQ